VKEIWFCRSIPTLCGDEPQIVKEGASQVAITNLVELSSRFIDIGIATNQDQHGVNNSCWKGPQLTSLGCRFVLYSAPAHLPTHPGF
jgi:hypothetical protein